MDIGSEEGKKIEEIFKILEISKPEQIEHMDKLGERLLMDMAAEAFIEKSEEFAGEISSKDDVAKFLLEKCSEDEIKEFTARVFRDASAEYFSKLIKDEDDEKKKAVEDILNSLE